MKWLVGYILKRFLGKYTKPPNNKGNALRLISF